LGRRAMVYTIEKTFRWQGKLTDKVVSVMKMFGLDLDRVNSNALCHKCQINLEPGDICYITGPSGAGKSVLLRELYNLCSPQDRINLNDVRLESDRCLIDCFEGGFLEGLKLLSKAGLSDVFAVLNRPDRLSDGQKYRYRLARALADGRKIIFADEFCSSLDRITAAVIAHNIRKFAKRNNKTFVLASSHDDLLADLAADVVIIKHLTGETEVIYRDRKRQKHSSVNR